MNGGPEIAATASHCGARTRWYDCSLLVYYTVLSIHTATGGSLAVPRIPRGAGNGI
jgi:hypothetical protein